jgi:murein L,D-transpeptidase YcbB/YkuD
MMRMLRRMAGTSLPLLALVGMLFLVPGLSAAQKRRVKHRLTKHQVAKHHLPAHPSRRAKRQATKHRITHKVPNRRAPRRRARRRRTHLPARPSSGRIEQIQQALARSGYYQGDPSGKWDASTVGAMKQFQQSHGITPTGKINVSSLQQLGLGSDVAGVAPPRPVVPVNASASGKDSKGNSEKR